MRMSSGNEEIDFSELIGEEVLYNSTEGVSIAVLRAFSTDSNVVTISLGEDEVKVDIGEIDYDIEHINQLKTEINKNTIDSELTRIRSLTSEQIKQEISEAGHVNVIMNFDTPESITINDFSNLSQLIPSAPNHDVIRALKERHKWDQDEDYVVDAEQHITHVNVIAAIAFPEAFFEISNEDEEEEEEQI